MLHISTVLLLAITGVPESTCSPASASPAAATASVVPFDAMPEGQIVVPLYVDGTGPWRFLIDTGSSRSAISEALAAKIGMPLVAQTAMTTGSGTSMRPVARLTNLTVGCARAQALLAPTLSAAELRRLGSGVVGVLGQDFLSRFSFTIDYRSNLLIWEFGEGDGQDTHGSQGGQTRQVRLPLREADGRFLVDLPMPMRTSLVPASAADSMVLFSSAGTTRLLANTAPDIGSLLPVEGQNAARLVRLKHLQIGAAVLWDVPAMVLVGMNGTEDVPEGDGLLPLSLFARVTFNPRLGYLELEAR